MPSTASMIGRQNGPTFLRARSSADFDNEKETDVFIENTKAAVTAKHTDSSRDDSQTASSHANHDWLSVSNLGKKYDNDGGWAVQNCNLSLRKGELFGLLGPSGCGKTTTLNMIAGFVSPSVGEIKVGGTDITHLKPYRRGIGMVFQSYALFPHLDVFRNVAFGPKRAGLPLDVIERRVSRLLDMVGLSGKARKYPAELSGGEQQRVAVARALAMEPELILLDEPLSNLDAKRREEMRRELRRIFKEAGSTVLFVTHDQAEAFAMCDRVAIMMQGEIRQVAAPDQIYKLPRTRDVAEFVGEGAFIEATIIGSNGDGQLRVRLQGLDGSETNAVSAHHGDIGKTGLVLLRPESVRLTSANPRVMCTVTKREILGAFIRYELAPQYQDLVCVELLGDRLATVGDRVGVTWDSRLAFVPSEGVQ